VAEPSSDAIWERDWPAGGLEAVDACPVCGSRDRSPAVVGMIDNVFFVAPGRWTLQRCGGCGSAYLAPRPTAETIGAAYASYYTHTPASPRGRAGLARRLYFAVADLYVKGRYLRSGPLARLAAALIAVFLQPLANRQDHRHRWMDPHRDGMSVLDAGCGNGEFLAVARGLGWEVEGFDLDERAVEAARNAGVRARVGTLESLAGELNGPYDTITMNHVIEHVYDPRRDLERAFQLLKPGGLLYVETPNIDALNLQTFGIHWRGLEAPRHLVLFSPHSLSRLLRDLGYTDVRVRRRDVFSGLYELSSRAEAAFKGSANPRRASLLQKLRGSFASKARLEFITVTARKPG